MFLKLTKRHDCWSLMERVILCNLKLVRRLLTCFHMASRSQIYTLSSAQKRDACNFVNKKKRHYKHYKLWSNKVPCVNSNVGVGTLYTRGPRKNIRDTFSALKIKLLKKYEFVKIKFRPFLSKWLLYTFSSKELFS